MSIMTYIKKARNKLYFNAMSAASITHNCCFASGPASPLLYDSLQYTNFYQTISMQGIWADFTRDFCQSKCGKPPPTLHFWKS